jgi:hypothetical protein
MLEHFVGLQPSYLIKMGHPPVFERKDGIFGRPVAYAGSTELAGRLTPLLHFLMQSNVLPQLIQTLLDNKEELSKLTVQINNILQVHISTVAKRSAKLASTYSCKEETFDVCHHRNIMASNASLRDYGQQVVA